MASRKDYAKNKRGAASASRSRPSTKKAPAKAKKRFPSGLLAITLILLGGLGYGLFKLTQIDRDPSTTPIANHSDPKPSVKKSTRKQSACRLRNQQRQPLRQRTPTASNFTKC